MSILWDLMGGDEHVAILLNEFFKGRTIEEIECQIFSVMDERIDDRADRKINEGFRAYRGSNNLDVEQSFENFERKLNAKQFCEIKNILKSFDNKIVRDEETQHELQNRISAIEKYIRTMPESKELALSCHLDDLEGIVRLKRFADSLFLHINNAGADEDSAFL